MGVHVTEKERWLEIWVDHDYPRHDRWLENGAVWPGGDEGAILPTAMKSICRVKPLRKPAQIERISWDSCLCWDADQFRFPPYQYSEMFLIWVGEKWRSASASERELLHGLGFDHTCLCWNASKIKGSPQGYEDLRKSLVGDSFSCYSFCMVAAWMCQQYQEAPPYHVLRDRMGMAPGFTCPMVLFHKLKLSRICTDVFFGESITLAQMSGFQREQY